MAGGEPCQTPNRRAGLPVANASACPLDLRGDHRILKPHPHVLNIDDRPIRLLLSYGVAIGSPGSALRDAVTGRFDGEEKARWSSRRVSYARAGTSAASSDSFGVVRTRQSDSMV